MKQGSTRAKTNASLSHTFTFDSRRFFNKTRAFFSHSNLIGKKSPILLLRTSAFAACLGSVFMMGTTSSSVPASRDEPIVDLSWTKHAVLGTQLVPLKGNDENGWLFDGSDQPNKRVVFATGCFWGSEKSFWRFPGVTSTTVGYVNGQTTHPTYEDVCSGQTGHTEAVQVYYDPTKVAFVDLLRQFLQSHDPTQGNGQGNDRGTQYRSGIYATDEMQAKTAKAGIAAYEKALKRKVTSEVMYPAPTYYYAEPYHQQYLAKPGARPYCSAQPTGVSLPPFASWAPEGTDPPKLGEDYWAMHAPFEGCVIRQAHSPIVWPPAGTPPLTSKQ